MGTIFVFRSKRADRLKILAWDGSGLILYWKRLEEGAFRWPPISDGVMRLSASQLAALVERSSAALVDMSWLPADADHLGSNGRREVIDRFVIAARGPLLDFADQLNIVYFNDPTRVRRIVGNGWDRALDEQWDRT